MERTKSGASSQLAPNLLFLHLLEKNELVF